MVKKRKFRNFIKYIILNKLAYLGSRLLSHIYLNTFNISNFITDNNYLSSTPSKTSVEVDIFFLVYILLLV